MVEIEGVSTLQAKEFAIQARTIAVICADDLAISHAERRFAAIRAVSANGADVLHFPGPGFISIGTGRERADRTNVNTGAAFITLQVVAAIRYDLGRDPAIS